MEALPAQTLYEYLGGEFQDDYGRTRRFIYPHTNCTIALPPTLPSKVRDKIIETSPYTAIITYSNSKPVAMRVSIKLDNGEFCTQEAFDTFDNAKRLMHIQINVFLKWFHKKSRIKQWFAHTERLCQQENRGKPSTPEQKLICAGLSIFYSYLQFASQEMEWLNEEAKESIFKCYLKWILPQHNSQQNQQLAYDLDFASQDLFFHFLLKDFLDTYKQQIHKGNSGSPETMGLIHKLKEGDFLILPREIVFEKYCLFLKAISPNCLLPEDATKFQKGLMGGGIELKHEANNDTSWRFRFYKDADKPLYCLGLQINSLPNNVKNELKSMFGLLEDATGNQNVTDTDPDDKERGKPHELNEF